MKEHRYRASCPVVDATRNGPTPAPMTKNWLRLTQGALVALVACAALGCSDDAMPPGIDAGVPMNPDANPDAGPDPDAGPEPDVVVTLEAVADVYIRESAPDTVYESDLVSVWSADADDGGRRYGLVSFDLSSLAGETVAAAQLQLYANAEHSGNDRAIRHTTSIVPGSAQDATWTLYQQDQAPSADILDGLRFALGPAHHAGEYAASTPASTGDVAKIQAAIDGAGLLTLAFVGVEEGVDYRQDWGDVELDNRPARLLLTIGTGPCAIATSALPDGAQASAYAAELTRTRGCPADVTWRLSTCGLPAGLQLDSTTGAISGTPEYGGPYPLDVELVDGQGQVLDAREVRLTVASIVDTRADFDHDGDVDDDDVAIFAGLETGTIANAPAVADAGIRAGANADSNFDDALGNIVPVEVDNAPTNPGDGNWKGYIAFDVSALGPVDGATLRLFTHPDFGGPSPAGLRVDVFGLLDGNDGWDETTLTWNNAPGNIDDDFDLDSSAVYGGGPLGTFATTGEVDTFSSPALDGFLQSSVGGDGLVTLILVVESDTGADGDFTVFYSHEETGREPRLYSRPLVQDARADFDGDGDVDDDDRAILQASFTGALSGDVDMCWRRYARTAIDQLLDVGTDTYGPEQTAMLMSVVDLKTSSAPALPPGEPCPGEDITSQPAGFPADACLRTEGRPDHGRLSQGGSNLWLDGPTVRAMYRLTDSGGDARYRQAADDYVADTLTRSVKDAMPAGLPFNRTFIWGSHSYYDAYADGPGGELWGAGPLFGEPIHEILVKQPEWTEFHRVDGQRVEDAIESIWNWHVIDKTTGLHNRHDSDTGGVLDFAYSGGSFTLAFASMYAQTGMQQWLDRATLLVQHHLDHVDPATGLVPDAPSSVGRYDSTHMMTSVSGPYAAQLLRSYELTGDPLFRDTAIDYILAYDEYGWDAASGTYYGMLALDGTPQLEAQGSGYGVWAPVGHVNIWRTAMYSYEFALSAAQAAVYAHSLAEPDDKSALLAVASNWAQAIAAQLPAGPGHRFGDVLRAHLPAVDDTQGTYAENYGRAISFFVNLYHATCETTCEPAHLDRAKLLAHEAVEKLHHPGGLLRGHPAKDTYQSSDGVGFLIHALLELDALPDRWRPAL